MIQGRFAIDYVDTTLIPGNQDLDVCIELAREGRGCLRLIGPGLDPANDTILKDFREAAKGPK